MKQWRSISNTLTIPQNVKACAKCKVITPWGLRACLNICVVWWCISHQSPGLISIYLGGEDKLTKNKTDKSKRVHWLFGGRVLMDEKSGQKILRSIFNPIHHFFLLCLDFLAVWMAFVRKRCCGKFGWSVLVDSSPKLIFGTLRYVKVF